MKRWIQTLVVIVATSSAAAVLAQEPQAHRDANGVIRFDAVRVEGRRQTAVSVLVPRQRDVVGEAKPQSTTFVRRVVRSVRSNPF